MVTYAPAAPGTSAVSVSLQDLGSHSGPRVMFQGAVPPEHGPWENLKGRVPGTFQETTAALQSEEPRAAPLG